MKPSKKKPQTIVSIRIRLPLASRNGYLKNARGDVILKNLSVHTRIKEVCNKLCDKLNVDYFTTRIEMWKKWGKYKLNW